MATRPQKPKPFDVKFQGGELRQLTDDLCREVEDALNMRATVIQSGGLIDLYDWFYEQGRSDPADRPFRGAADLTSFFFTENIDAMRSRLMQAVFKVEPFCLVDGWGQDASKAPFVEAFHEWQVEEEGLEEELGKVCHGALIEDAYILEVRERIETRRIVEEIDAALDMSTGATVMEVVDGEARPKLQRDDNGEPVQAQEGQPAAKIKRDYVKTKRLGPEYDTISMKDFVYLPGHAKNQRQVWGYAYRFWSRVPELNEKVDDGIYDKAAVAALGDTSDREDSDVPRTVDGVASQYGQSSEKELFQLSLKRDLDGDGREEWYLVTLSLKNRQILRVKLDTFVMKVGRPRCVPFVLYPRRNSVYGYAYAGDKLLTLAEEHTALRNMVADRSALATNSPLMQLQGGLWDPDAQPIGIGEVITVRDHNEVKQMQITDVPQSVIYMLRDITAAKERVGGLSDIGAIGSGDRQSQTLGQDQLVAHASAVRVEEPLGYLRKAIAHVMQLRHAIWVETLEAEGGIEAPEAVVSRLAMAGNELTDGKFTADKLKGRFRFKPYGSVDSADAGARMQYYNQGLIALGNVAKMFPMVSLIFQNQDVAVRIVQEWARVYKVRDVNVFLKALQPPQQPMLPQASGMSAGDPMHPEGAAPPDIMQMLQGLVSGQPQAPGDGFASYH
jgi:hypothetical protein